MKHVPKIFYLYIIYSIIFFLVCSTAISQENPWNNKKCAVVLTYDDAFNVHLDNVVPLLDSLGFKATFYIPASFNSFRQRINQWITVGKNGHELGNHTLFHPCEGKSPGREWVNPTYDLNIYTVQRLEDEIDVANSLLETMDGKKYRTFAYTCGDMKLGSISFVDVIKNRFIGARGIQSKIEKINDIDLYNIGSFMIINHSAEQMIALVKQAIETNGLIVFLFHGVGGEHYLNVSLDAHRSLLQFLKQNEMNIWVAPMVDIVKYINDKLKTK